MISFLFLLCPYLYVLLLSRASVLFCLCMHVPFMIEYFSGFQFPVFVGFTVRKKEGKVFLLSLVLTSFR
jgi:hypothetical protein